jgi:hypothetical protein
MVARHVQQRHVEPAHEVFEVVERQVAAGDRQVGPQRGQAVGVQRLVDLVRDREDARQRFVRRA